MRLKKSSNVTPIATCPNMLCCGIDSKSCAKLILIGLQLANKSSFWRCFAPSFLFLEKCVLPFHFAQSSVLAISNSHHDNVRASSILFIWLHGNGLFSSPLLVLLVESAENILQKTNYSSLILAKIKAQNHAFSP
jgi:hypothetical protein